MITDRADWNDDERGVWHVAFGCACAGYEVAKALGRDRGATKLEHAIVEAGDAIEAYREAVERGETPL